MLHSLLIGIVGGMRSMTPLAAVALAARNGELPSRGGAAALLAHPLAVRGALAIAAGELLGDKMKSAPDRIVPAGIAARLVTGALCGAAVAPQRRQVEGAVLGAVGAIIGAYPTFNLRIRAMDRYGQTLTGIIEDGIAVAAATAIVRDAWPERGAR